MTPTLSISQERSFPAPNQVNNTKEIYQGWHEVPFHLLPASKWMWKYNRKPIKAASALVEWEVDCLWPKRATLYSYEDTRPYQPTERTLAYRWFIESFQRTSSKERYLWTARDKWISCSGKLSRHHVRQHINQMDIYGALGGRYTRFVAIDLDLHGGDYVIFLRQLDALLGKLWGTGPWFLQVADNDARGVHLVYVFSRAIETDVAVGRLRGILRELDSAHASLAQRAKEAGMRSLGDLEVYPDPKHGFRLPFAQGRTLLLNRPLDLVAYRGKQVADVSSLWKWCQDRSRFHMSQAQVLGYVAGRLEMGGPQRVTIAKPSCDDIAAAPPAEEMKMKGRYRQFLTEFWSGHNNQPNTLNKGIRLLTLISPYYFPGDPPTAARTVERMIDDLPDWSFSSRLSSGDRVAVSRVVRQNIETAFRNSNASSKRKLDKTFKSWKSRGFNPFDSKTWTSTSHKPTWKWLESDLAEIGKFSTILKCDVGVAEQFIRQLIHFVASSGREMSINYLKVVMRGMSIKVGSKRENKPKQVIDRLIGLEWLYLRVLAGPGRARAFGLGHVMRDRMSQANPMS